MTLSDVGSIASIMGFFISLFLTVKVYNLYIQVNKLNIDNSDHKKENTSFFSLFVSQKNE